jgi:hypothetical protein
LFATSFSSNPFQIWKAGGKINDTVIKKCCPGAAAALMVIVVPPYGPTATKALKIQPATSCAPVSQTSDGLYIPEKDTLDGQAKVIYRFKDGRTSKTFEALDWLAQLVTHIPNKGEQMVRYIGYYSNKSREMRKKAGIDDQVPASGLAAPHAFSAKALYHRHSPCWIKNMLFLIIVQMLSRLFLRTKKSFGFLEFYL